MHVLQKALLKLKIDHPKLISTVSDISYYKYL